MKFAPNDKILILPPWQEQAASPRAIYNKFRSQVAGVVCLGNYFDAPSTSNDANKVRSVHSTIDFLEVLLQDEGAMLVMGRHDLQYWAPHQRCWGYNPTTQRLINAELPWKDVGCRFRLGVPIDSWLLSSCGWITGEVTAQASLVDFFDWISVKAFSTAVNQRVTPRLLEYSYDLGGRFGSTGSPIARSWDEFVPVANINQIMASKPMPEPATTETLTTFNINLHCGFNDVWFLQNNCLLKAIGGVMKVDLDSHVELVYKPPIIEV